MEVYLFCRKFGYNYRLGIVGSLVELFLNVIVSTIKHLTESCRLPAQPEPTVSVLSRKALLRWLTSAVMMDVRKKVHPCVASAMKHIIAAAIVNWLTLPLIKDRVKKRELLLRPDYCLQSDPPIQIHQQYTWVLTTSKPNILKNGQSFFKRYSM